MSDNPAKLFRNKFCELQVSNDRQVLVFEEFEKFYSECSEFYESKLKEVDLTAAQRKIISSNTLTEHERKQLIDSIEFIKDIQSFFELVGAFTRNQLGVLRVMSKSKIDVSDLLSAGMNLNKEVNTI